MAKQNNKKSILTRTPFRLEVILPLAVFYLLVSFYMLTMFDSHVKRALEWSLTKINGAEVNIAKFETSFIGTSLNIEDVQVTNRENPEENVFQFAQYFFDLNVDAFLRAKLVIDDAVLSGVGLFTPRSSPGRVLSRDGEGDDFFSRLREEILSQISEQYEGTPIADLGAILEGADFSDQISNLTESLHSQEQIKQMQESLLDKEDFWSQKINDYESGEPLSRLEQRISDFEFNSSKPQESFSQITDLLNEVESEANQIKEISGQFNEDLTTLKQMPSRAQALIDEDIQFIRSRIRIPSIEADSFAMSLFGRFFGDIISQYTLYSEAAKQYMPPPSDESEDDADESRSIRPRERALGQNYHFTVKGNYPLFWLKHASIDSSGESRVWSGDFSGVMTNLTNEPAIIGLPGKIKLEGSLTERQVEGMEFNLNFHHHKKPFFQSLNFSTQSFPVSTRSLSSSDSLKLELIPKFSSFNFKAKNTLSDDYSEIDVNYTHRFHEPQFEIKAQSSTLQKILENSLFPLEFVELNAQAKGPLRRLSWRVNTNMARAIERGVRGEVEEKIAQEHRRIKDSVESKVQPILDEYNAKLSQFEDRFKAHITRLNKISENLETRAQNKINEATKAPKQEVKEKVREKSEDAIDSLRRRFRP